VLGKEAVVHFLFQVTAFLLLLRRVTELPLLDVEALVELLRRVTVRRHPHLEPHHYHSGH
jgi:hypothetical protein